MTDVWDVTGKDAAEGAHEPQEGLDASAWDDGPVVPVKAAGSALEALRAEGRKKATPDPVTLSTPGRDGFKVRYRADVSVNRLGHWQKAAKDRDMPDGVDVAKLAAMILTAQCEAIVFEDADVLDEDSGKVVTFTHPVMKEITGKDRPADVVRFWYGESDGVMMMAVAEIMRASGFDEDWLTKDPTKPS